MFKHFQDMALFASLISAGSFTKLSTQLDIPKSRVSQRIHALEETLGIRLLNRTTRRVSLTSAGERYLIYCNEMLRVGVEADAFVKSITVQPGGKLRIIAPVGLMVASLSKLNYEFISTNQDVKIEMLTADTFYESIEGAFDVAFRVGKPVEQSYIGRLLGEFNRMLVASPQYLIDKKISHPSDLINYDVSVHKTWKSLTIYNEFENVVFLNEPCQVTDNLQYLLECTLQGGGISVLPEYLIQSHLALGTLKIILPEWKLQKIDIWLVYSSNKNNSLLLKAYVDFILSSDLKII